jgi:hypothetical protein
VCVECGVGVAWVGCVRWRGGVRAVCGGEVAWGGCVGCKGCMGASVRRWACVAGELRACDAMRSPSLWPPASAHALGLAPLTGCPE